MAYPPDKYSEVKLEGIELKPDEPWFLLRGQDKLTPYAMEAYADLLAEEAPDMDTAEGVDRLLEMAADIRSHAQAVRDWQKANPQYVKLPD